jgi:hypothetical protein
MNLTENFKLHEMTDSLTAKKRGIDNTPYDEKVINNLKDLCENVLEPLRAIIKKPIIISSGYRSGQLNSYIGGAISSQHVSGQAADISMGMNNAEVFKAIVENIEFDQLIWEFGSNENPEWVHVSFSSTHNRKQILRAAKEHGKTVYLPMSATKAEKPVKVNKK